MMDHSWNLKRHPTFQGRPGPVVLVVMDGIGMGAGDDGDAVALAHTPTLNGLRQTGLFTQLQAHGTAVGMPSDDDMGNSEVGHNAMGAGRVFAQGARLVNDAISTGDLFRTETWRGLVDPCVRQDTALHLLGLVSDGNVHSHIDHLFALISAADAAGVPRVFVHFLFDGRDVAQISAHLYVDQLEQFLTPFNRKPGRRYQIASGGGRMKVTMDRYQADWAMVARGWNAHVHGIGRSFRSTQEALETFRRETPGITDQYLPEFVIVENEEPVGKVQDGDAFVLFNFRGDRAIEITQAFEQEHFPHFDRGVRPKVRFAGMMQYDGDLKLPSHFLVSPPAIAQTFGEFLARNQIPQVALSETQKYGHVTYFWNGNRSGMFDDKVERYIEIPSDQVPFDERPWMKAAEITDITLQQLKLGWARFIRLNLANGDMVGHTGSLEATRVAVEAVDLSLARIMKAVEQALGILIVTADHGNADEMFMKDKKGRFERDALGRPLPKTSHTLNPVPFIIYDPLLRGEYGLNSAVQTPGLANIASTVVNLMGFEAPELFEPSLITFRPS